MNGANTVPLQDEDRWLHSAGRILLDHDCGRDPSQYVLQIDIIGGKFPEPVLRSADCAAAHEHLNLAQDLAHCCHPPGVLTHADPPHKTLPPGGPR